ncbi:hypothetical protein V496_04921, partial [Pseudogymnoascus sp. VKM F-4515 (FW-2607)]
PSTSWNYGGSYELLGRLIERLTSTSLTSYMQTHIWAPLSMTRISFDPHSPAIAPSLADSTLRGPNDTYLHSPNGFFREGTQFDSAGAGLFASPAEDDGLAVRTAAKP